MQWDENGNWDNSCPHCGEEDCPDHNRCPENPDTWQSRCPVWSHTEYCALCAERRNCDRWEINPDGR